MKKCLSIAIMLAALAAVASATTVRPASVERLSQLASVVIEARATRSWTEWNAQHTAIYTYTEFQVARALKGQPGQTVVVRQRGGEKDGLRQVLFGVRHFQPGEDAVLFLQPAENASGALQVVDLMQGNFRVSRTTSGAASVSNGVPGVKELSDNGQLRTYTGMRMTLQELETRVRKAVTK